MFIADTCSYKGPVLDYLKDKDAFVKLVQTEADSFTPPGERVATYQPNAVASSSKKQLNGSSSASIDFDIYRVRCRPLVSSFPALTAISALI